MQPGLWPQLEADANGRLEYRICRRPVAWPGQLPDLVEPQSPHFSSWGPNHHLLGGTVSARPTAGTPEARPPSLQLSTAVRGVLGQEDEARVFP